MLPFLVKGARGFLDGCGTCSSKPEAYLDSDRFYPKWAGAGAPPRASLHLRQRASLRKKKLKVQAVALLEQREGPWGSSAASLEGSGRGGQPWPPFGACLRL